MLATLIIVFREVIEAGLVISGFISDGNVMGKVLHTLIGYTARPTGMQFMVYLVTLAGIFTLMRLFGDAPPLPSKTALSVAA